MWTLFIIILILASIAIPFYKIFVAPKIEIKINLMKYTQDDFGPIITDPMEFKEAMRYIIKTDFELYSKLLALYHLRQSFYIILKSKNEEIISSRIEFAKERLGDLKSMNISKDEFVKIENKFNTLLKEAQTSRYINQIDACIVKIHTLKTKKAKEKHLLTAKTLISDARINQETDQTKISEIEQKLTNIII